MKFEEHCEQSEVKFGKRYEEVHRWLDEFANRYSPSRRYKHRKHRHHKEGVEEARKVFGDLGALVAEDHIRSENYGYLPSPEDYNLPEYDDDF